MIYFPDDVSLGTCVVATLDWSLHVCSVIDKTHLVMPAYCVAANCKEPKTTHAFPQYQPAVRRQWIKFAQFKHADFAAVSPYTHLCCEHFTECDFVNLVECSMGFASQWNLSYLKPTAFQSVHKAPKQTWNFDHPPPSPLTLTTHHHHHCWQCHCCCCSCWDCIWKEKEEPGNEKV